MAQVVEALPTLGLNFGMIKKKRKKEKLMQYDNVKYCIVHANSYTVLLRE
jgi:hypothetical protein